MSKWSESSLNSSVKSPWTMKTMQQRKPQRETLNWMRFKRRRVGSKQQRQQATTLSLSAWMVWVFVNPGRDQKTKDKEIRLRSFGVHDSPSHSDFLSFTQPQCSLYRLHLLMCNCTFIITLRTCCGLYCQWMVSLASLAVISFATTRPSTVIWW